ncbi:hypothetical protein BJF89_01080 [Corynebacterium sp. CNJ-954]|uniref:hypothetical protein n=1 Tax=Corynebacterium sp. CNJ-954 TaxID=1904962 RepID=UPI0009668034|nr:hypothetical protein [Corynebacterium sp. CNJ-954]OLT54855.1 hypothetical protein BJF89_01080 [Corynebacterium sp. CNJ-954]
MKTRIEGAAQTINLTDANASPMDMSRALDAGGHLMPDLPEPLTDASGDPYWQVGPYTRVWTATNPHGPNHIYVGDPYDVECIAMFINLDRAEQAALAILRAVQIERNQE